jgi:hypothetical protein
MRNRLQPGPELDRLVHELLGLPRTAGAEIPAYSTDPAAIGPVIEHLAGRTRYLGLIHSYDGLWFAMDADSVDQLSHVDGTIVEEDAAPTRVEGETLSHAACLLAVSLQDEHWKLPTAP